MARTVLFLHASAGLYGADRQLLTLAGGLDRTRFTAVAVLPEKGPLGALLEKVGVAVVIRPLSVLGPDFAGGGGARDARDRKAIVRLAKRQGAALIHSNHARLLAGGPAAQRCGLAHVVHVREIAAPQAADRMRAHVQGAAALVCPSEAVAAQFADWANVKLIPDCLVRAPLTAIGAVVRKAMKIAPDAFVVTQIARVGEGRGQELLARALAEPELAEIGAVGLVVGDPHPGDHAARDALAALAEELGLGDRLRLLGFRDDIGTPLGASDAVAILPGRPEPPSQVALEAGWAGLPVVASAAGGQPEIVRDGETGLLVAPADHEALARALRDLADDRERAKALGEAGSRAVRDAPDCRQMIEAIQALYDEIAPAAKRRGL